MPATSCQAGLVLWMLALGVSAEDQLPHSDYLATIPVEGGEPRVLIKQPGCLCGSPRWSPDGRWIAYDTIPLWRLGLEPRLVRVIRADGSEDRIVGDGGMPSWSPDGRDLVWHTYERKSIVVARADGSAREEIASNWFAPVWLRSDPRRVVTLSYGTLSLGDLKTVRSEPVLASPEGVIRGYSVSPSGDRVSYLNGLKQLCVAELKSGGVERVLLSEGTAGYSSWSPEGDRLVVSWSPKVVGRQQLYVISLDDTNGEPRKIAGQDESVPNLNPDWSPDGKTIAYRQAHPVSSK